MIVERIRELETLPAEEKLILVGELWDQLSTDPTAVPVRKDHLKILQERVDHFRQHPEDMVAWEDVKARILSSR